MKKSVLFLALAIIFSACSKSSHPDYFGTVKPSHPVDELWIDIASEPKDMDPVKVADSVSSTVSVNMFIRLVQDKPKTGEIIPDLAKSWEISKDGREYTFHLREDAIWSDGKPITSSDVEYSWKRLSDSATGANYSQLMDAVENARAFREKAVQIIDLKTDLKTLEQKIKTLVPVKDVTQDKELGVFFVFIDSEDAKEKDDYRNKVIDEVQKGFLGASTKAQLASSDVIKMKALDDHTFWVRLEKPVPYFLGLIEYACFAPVPQHLIEKLKAENKADLWTRPTNIIVSGPFILVEEEFKQYKIFKKNPKYFNASKVRLNKVKTLMIDDYAASLNAYKTGQHDWSAQNSIPTDMTETVSKFKDYNRDPQLGTYYYEFNVSRKPLNDVNVRRALSLAVDRKAIVENITRAGQKPTRSVVAWGIPGYVAPEASIYDPEAAKKFLTKAGYPGGKGFPKFTLKYNTSEGHRKIAEAIQQMWKSNLGIEVNITNMEWSSLNADRISENFDMSRMAWIGDYLDPHTFLSIFTSESKNNHTRWRNKRYDQLIQASDGSLNQKERYAYFVEAEKILNDETPIMPIYHYTRSYMRKPYLKGFWPQYQDRHPWKYIWVDERWYKGAPTTEVPDEPWAD